MNKTIEAIENASGVAWHALVWHEVLIGLGILVLSIGVMYALFIINKRFNIFRNQNVNHMIIFGFVGLITVSVFGYGLLHVLNPGYFALQNGLDLIKN